ncbi:squamosa promoter-binding-like protein 3 [Actinidia eriantha]|uniref:squamosa promoter-binding-like protein 3 n=1 Tax=Actinidia eriantha TaxID=165200 RepID=UPI00258B1C0A|nr:squamosa promoter-binding-like protein 3 [Actinidia eriantha]
MDATSIFKDKAADDDSLEEEDDSYDGEFLFKKKKLVFASGSGKKGSEPSCQAERCVADLSDAKRYYRRHRVCQVHFKAAVVTVAGLRQRFCQQCSRFHELSEFDDTKRSCRKRLAGHNERRRKGSSESRGEGSGRCQNQPREGDNRCETLIAFPGTPTYKQFRIR